MNASTRSGEDTKADQWQERDAFNLEADHASSESLERNST